MSHRRIKIISKTRTEIEEVTKLIVDEISMKYHYVNNIYTECLINEIKYGTNIKLKNLPPYIEAGYKACKFCKPD